MPEESTAVTTLAAVEAQRDAGDAFGAPCGGCGLRNPAIRRSCLACGAPLGGYDDAGGPLPIDPPLIEREEQTAAIDACVERFVTKREGGVIAITAPRGLGATRLLRFTAERLLASGKVRLLTTTIREADGSYAPVTRLLWERFGITPAKGAQAARTELEAEVNRVLASRGGPPTELARRIVLAAGLPADGNTSGRWETEATRGMPRLVEALARFLSADAEQLPIAILVDNLDAAPDEGFAVFHAVITALQKAPVLVVVVGEPSLLDRLGALPRTAISARALSPEGGAQLVRHLLPGLQEVPNELLDALVRRAEGSPGQLREMLLALIESRVLLVEEVPWRVDLDALGSAGPVSTADVIGFRLGRLDPESRGMLARAAVVGEVFWEGAIAAMVRTDEGDVDPFGDDTVSARVTESLRHLVAAELIAPIEESELALEREYAFAIAGLRETVLRAQDAATLRRHHDVCASWLELAAGSRADDLARAIAGHLEKAGLGAAAARGYLRAARAARASYRGPQAVQLFDRALALLNVGDGPTRIDALHDKGVVLSLLGRVDDATRTFTDMYVLAHRYGARNKMAAALGRLGRLARGRGDFDASRDYLSNALSLFQHAEDMRGVAGVEDDLGMLAFLGSDFDSAIEHSTRALEIRRNLEDPLGEALSTHNLGLVHFARGQPRQARAHFERAFALREKHGDIEGTVTTRNALAALAFDRGDVDQAEGIWREILELAEALGDKRMILYATGNLGEVAISRGDATLASQLLDAAEEMTHELDDRRALAEVQRSRGMLAKSAGDSGRARYHFEQSLGLAQQLGVREAEALALRGLGETFAETVFDPEAPANLRADRYFDDAIRILEEVGATRELARTRAAYGVHLVERGDTAQGRKLLTLAVPVLERLELAEARRTRHVLQQAGGEGT